VGSQIPQFSTPRKSLRKRTWRFHDLIAQTFNFQHEIKNNRLYWRASVEFGIQTIGQQFKKKPCRVFPSDLKLRIEATGLYSYPDLSVVCGEPQLDSDGGDVLLNPVVLVEVLSDSTEAYDRGKRFEHYRTIPSLNH